MFILFSLRFGLLNGQKIISKFETLRREIKADIRKQHDLYVNNLVGDLKAYPRDFIVT